jgi:hypothetical protein
MGQLVQTFTVEALALVPYALSHDLGTDAILEHAELLVSVQLGLLNHALYN